MGKLSRLCLLAGLALAPCGCNNQDADHLANVARLSAAKVDELTGGAPGKMHNGIEAFRANWNEVTLQTRVASRLRWDKELEGLEIQVQMHDGAVELSGAVANLTQRQRAVQLARSTTGVGEVIDLLETPTP
jgi:osmotically-inducible protein OsmY